METVKIKASELRSGDLWTGSTERDEWRGRWVLCRSQTEYGTAEVDCYADSLEVPRAIGLRFGRDEEVEIELPRPGPVTEDSATRQPLARFRDELLRQIKDGDRTA